MFKEVLGKKVVSRIVSLVVIGTFVFNNGLTPSYALRQMVTDDNPGKEAKLATEILGPKYPIRTELLVPEYQPEGFFTNDYHGYTIQGLLAKPLEKIPYAVVRAVRNKLNKDIAQGKILSAEVKDFGGMDVDIHVTHRYGELNATVQRLMLEAMKEGALKAEQLGLLKEDIDVASMELDKLGETLRVKANEHSITERGSEPVVIAKIIGAGIGAANIKLYHEFFMPGATPLKKLGFVPQGKPGVRGFRAIVRRTEDVLRGNFNGPVWEFENSSDFEDANGKKYPAKNQHEELLVLASQPNDFVITAVYTVEGASLPSTEPLVTVVYQPVYGEKGDLRTLNPTFIHRSQSGADAVGGIASMYYDVNSVPGGPDGEHYVVTRPATLEQARKAPPEGIAHVVVYGWQSKENGVIPEEKDGRIDHVAINYPALGPERRLANFLSSVLITHPNDQPYLAPFAAEARVAPLRKAQSHLFSRAPKEADIDPVMDEVEAKVASGEYLSVTDDKADMGGKLGHNYTPEYMLAIDRATAMEAQEQGKLTDGNIIGFIDQMRLKRGTTVSIGDDSHILMLGDKSRNSAESHQLSFLAFTRGYLAAVVNEEKPYGLAQDYQGKEAKAAKANPYFYSHLSERFFQILYEVMPIDYRGMVDKMYLGWKEWEETKATVTLPEPFSGNVSQQGIGSARYPVNIAGRERTFGILAGDKMGPAGINRPIREGVYALLETTRNKMATPYDEIKLEDLFDSLLEFRHGLVFEIWDAKAFDEEGNIPLDKLPELYADVADVINELKEESEKDFVKNAYTKDGELKKNLSSADKDKLPALLKRAGYVPTERIYLDAQADKEAVYFYLADSDRLNIKQVWSKSKSGWDINNPQEYLSRPILGSSVTKLGILAGGEYIGKDDPVMVGNILLMEHIYEFVEKNPILLQGDMNGSHWLAAIPTAFKNAVASKESHPILVGLRYTLSDDGKTLASVEDVFGDKRFNAIRKKMFEFNHKFKIAQLGGQFEPYGTNVRTVEASYPLAKFLRALEAPDSPFMISNMPAAERELRPIGKIDGLPDLFKVATVGNIEPDQIAFNGGQSFEELWGPDFAPVAEEFSFDIDIQPELAMLIENVHSFDEVYPIVMHHEVLQSLPGIMLLQNLASSYGPENIKLIVDTDGDTINIAGKERQLSSMTATEQDKLADEIFAEINAIARANNVPPLYRDIITAVVTGKDAADVARQVKEKFGADISQVIGGTEYKDKFKDIVKTRIVLDKTDGQFASWAKALKLAINLIPVDGEMSAEYVKQLDEAFSKDSDGNYHVQAASLPAGSKVATILDSYDLQVATKVKI